MPRLRPAYFEVTEPFRVLVAVGTSDSNTEIRGARVIETRYEARNARPGSIVHSLPGGTFLQDPDGTLHEARLRHPKPVMEKSYGGTVTDERRLDGMLAAGRLREAAPPAGRPDYAGARERGRVRLPPLRGGVVTLEQSVELAAFRADMAGLAEAFAADGGTVAFRDLGEGDAVTMAVAYPGSKDGPSLFRSAIDGRTWATGEVPGGSPLREPFAAVSGRGAMAADAFAAAFEPPAAAPAR